MNYNLFRKLPYILQNILVSIYNYKQYAIRHGGNYPEYLDYYDKSWNMSIEDLNEQILNKRKSFLNYAVNNSSWYNKFIDFKDLKDFDVLSKTDLINNLGEISTIAVNLGIVSLTGGTTGASMKVIYTKENILERFAILDSFRKRFGYELGRKTAWFSGKNLITDQDLEKGRCSHYDFINKI